MHTQVTDCLMDLIGWSKTLPLGSMCSTNVCIQKFYILSVLSVSESFFREHYTIIHVYMLLTGVSSLYWRWVCTSVCCVCVCSQITNHYIRNDSNHWILLTANAAFSTYFPGALFFISFDRLVIFSIFMFSFLNMLLVCDLKSTQSL